MGTRLNRYDIQMGGPLCIGQTNVKDLQTTNKMIRVQIDNKIEAVPIFWDSPLNI